MYWSRNHILRTTDILSQTKWLNACVFYCSLFHYALNWQRTLTVSMSVFLITPSLIWVRNYSFPFLNTTNLHESNLCLPSSFTCFYRVLLIYTMSCRTYSANFNMLHMRCAPIQWENCNNILDSGWLNK